MKDSYSDNLVTFAGTFAEGASGDTPLVCEVIDNQGFESLLYELIAGDIADANVTFVVLLEESDTSFSGSNVADIDLIGTELLAAFLFGDDNSTKKLGYKGSKRYTRMTITPSGNTGLIDMAVIALQGSPDVRPAA